MEAAVGGMSCMHHPLNIPDAIAQLSNLQHIELY